MKKSDIAMIILIASASVMISYLIVSSLPMFASSEQEERVETAEKITTEIIQPDESVFNGDAINPTVEVIIGDTESPASNDGQQQEDS